MTGQRRSHSAIESIANVVVGYGVAVTAQIVVFPLFGIKASVDTNLRVAAVFTVISLVRSYTLRRVFNRLAGATH